MSFTYNLSSFLPFRDKEACDRVRAIPRSAITDHDNPDFRIRVVDEPDDFYDAFANDLVGRIRDSRDAGAGLVAILPVGPVPQYAKAARMINEERISLEHLTTFNMDEYANEDGVTAPQDWVGSFQTAMWRNFFGLVDEDLRPKVENIHFPTSENVGDYSKMIEDAGDADVCYGGIGWSGHIAFWEPQLGSEYPDREAYVDAGSRIVELHPITIMQNALHSFRSDWSWVPPKAATIGIRDILRARHRSFWLDGKLGGNATWQAFIARLVAHGPVNEFVPGSFLQEYGADYTIIGTVADDVVIEMA